MRFFLLSSLILFTSSCNIFLLFKNNNGADKDFSTCYTCSGDDSQSGNPNLQNDLLAFYDFESANIGEDISGNSLHLQSSNGYTRVPGPHSANALNCSNSGSGNTLHALNSSVLAMGTSTDFTISFWAYFTATPSGALIDWYDGGITNYISFDGSNKIKILFDTPTIVSTNAPALNNWAHYAFVVDRDVGITLYIDGVINKSTSVDSTGVNLVSDRLQICSRGTPNGGNSVINSVYLDNLGFWSRALSAEDINDLYLGDTP